MRMRTKYKGQRVKKKIKERVWIKWVKKDPINLHTLCLTWIAHTLTSTLCGAPKKYFFLIFLRCTFTMMWVYVYWPSYSCTFSCKCVITRHIHRIYGANVIGNSGVAHCFFLPRFACTFYSVLLLWTIFSVYFLSGFCMECRGPYLTVLASSFTLL